MFILSIGGGQGVWGMDKNQFKSHQITLTLDTLFQSKLAAYKSKQSSGHVAERGHTLLKSQQKAHAKCVPATSMRIPNYSQYREDLCARTASDNCTSLSARFYCVPSSGVRTGISLTSHFYQQAC